MADPRNPRIDPRPGDILACSQYRLTVLAVGETVEWSAKDEHTGMVYRNAAPLDRWRAIVAIGRVIHVAPPDLSRVIPAVRKELGVAEGEPLASVLR